MDKIILPNKPNAEQRKMMIEKTFEGFLNWLEKSNLPTPNYDEIRFLYYTLAFNQYQQIMQAQHNADMAKLTANKDMFLKLLDAQQKAQESMKAQAPVIPAEVIETNGENKKEEPIKLEEAPSN